MLFSSTKRQGRNISKNLSNKCSQKLLGHAKQSATDALKTSSKRVIQKKAEVTVYLIGDKIADRIARVSNTSPQNNLETNEKIHMNEDNSSNNNHYHVFILFLLIMQIVFLLSDNAVRLC